MSNTYDESKSWTIHDRLRDLRHRLGLVRYGSKAEMASLLGVSAPRYGQWESDLVRTRAREGREADERLASLAAALAEAERSAAPRPRPRTVIVVDGDVVAIRETRSEAG